MSYVLPFLLAASVNTVTSSGVLPNTVQNANAFSVSLMSANVQRPKMAMMDHSHMPITAPKTAQTVRLDLEISDDAMSGYNLTIHTQNYVMQPPPAQLSMAEMMSPSLAGEQLLGHAHLYINGEKIQRVYGKYLHLPQTLFKAGTNSISVSLNNHGHMYWQQSGKKVIATLMIEHQSPVLVKHSFSSFPLQEQ